MCACLCLYAQVGGPSGPRINYVLIESYTVHTLFLLYQPPAFSDSVDCTVYCNVSNLYTGIILYISVASWTLKSRPVLACRAIRDKRETTNTDRHETDESPIVRNADIQIRICDRVYILCKYSKTDIRANVQQTEGTIQYTASTV